MRIRILDKNGDPVVAQTVPAGGSVVVEPVDPDNRTQAERNAQNALDAARLARVEAHLGDAIDGAEMLLAQGAKRVDVTFILQVLREALAAPVA